MKNFNLFLNGVLKDVHRRKKLMTDSFQVTMLVVPISSEKSILTTFSRAHILRGQISKSEVSSIFNSS